MKRTGVIVAFVGMGLVIFTMVFGLIFNGVDLSGFNYAIIEVNPKIEFVLKGEKVISYHPINQEAKELLINEEFMGLNIETAVQKFLDLCTRAGYMDVETENNIIKVGSVSQISQALQVKIYNAADYYLNSHEVMGAIIENNNIEQIIKRAKDYKIGTDRLMLLDSYLRLYPNDTMKDAMKKSNAKLIRLINEKQLETDPMTDYNAEELMTKKLLLDLNREKFGAQQEKITTVSQRQFKEKFRKETKKIKLEYTKNFDKSYEVWKTNHINFVH